MRPYSSVKSLFGLSYTCLPGSQVLRQLGETGPEYLKSCVETHEKESKVLAFYFTSNETLL